jgi:phospholipid/cholesterol/gamma-HCH transport system substrate-binding protein
VRDLGVAAHNYVASIPRLNSIVDSVNGVANEAAYNPRGREPAGTPGRDEGYLYWVAWLAQHGETVFGAQDANGLFRRIYLTASCSNAAEILSTNPLGALVDPIAQLFASGGVCN